MAEPGLALDFEDLQNAVGRMLGLPTSTTDWHGDEISDVNAVVQEGYRRFLAAHNWSFLRPWTTLSLVDDEWEYDLPDDFGSLVGAFHYDENVRRGAIIHTSVARIMELRSCRDRSLDPTHAAIRAKAGTPGAGEGQRFEAVFYPTPNAARTLHYQYNLVPDALASGEYPLGGAQHAQTIRAGCLAVAEEFFEDSPLGPRAERYRVELEKSVAIDRRNQPRFLGQMTAGEGTVITRRHPKIIYED